MPAVEQKSDFGPLAIERQIRNALPDAFAEHHGAIVAHRLPVHVAEHSAGEVKTVRLPLAEIVEEGIRERFRRGAVTGVVVDRRIGHAAAQSGVLTQGYFAQRGGDHERLIERVNDANTGVLNVKVRYCDGRHKYLEEWRLKIVHCKRSVYWPPCGHLQEADRKTVIDCTIPAPSRANTISGTATRP